MKHLHLACTPWWQKWDVLEGKGEHFLGESDIKAGSYCKFASSDEDGNEKKGILQAFSIHCVVKTIQLIWT